MISKIITQKPLNIQRLPYFQYIGGDEEDRTLDLTDANRTLSQTVQFYAPQTTQETADNNQILSEKSEKSIWPCSILHGTSQEASILR